VLRRATGVVSHHDRQPVLRRFAHDTRASTLEAVLPMRGLTVESFSWRLARRHKTCFIPGGTTPRVLTEISEAHQGEAC